MKRKKTITFQQSPNHLNQPMAELLFYIVVLFVFLAIYIVHYNRDCTLARAHIASGPLFLLFFFFSLISIRFQCEMQPKFCNHNLFIRMQTEKEKEQQGKKTLTPNDSFEMIS